MVGGDSGILEVAASSDSDITTVSATLTATDGTTTVETLQLFSGTAKDGVWQSARLKDLPYGDYTLSVTVTDTDGDETTAQAATDVVFRRMTRVKQQAVTPATLDFQHSQVLATGTLVAFDPRTGDETPLAGTEVRLTVGNYVVSKLTASDGSYRISMAAQASTPGEPVAIQVEAYDPNALGLITIYSAAIPSRLYETRVRLDKTAQRFNYGTKLVVSGIVEYLDGATWKPAPGVLVSIDYDYANARSGSDGRFTLTYPFILNNDGTWHITVTPSEQLNPFLVSSQATFTVDVVNKVTVSLSSSGLDEFSDLRFRGQMSSSSSVLPATRKIYVQQSSNGSSGWKNLGYFTVGKSGAFDITGWVQHPKGYWRLYFPAQTDYQAAYSKTVHYSRIETRIVSFNAAPEPIRKGSYATVKGTMQTLSGSKFVGKSKTRVYIYHRAKGAKTYKYLGYTTTNTKGQFSKKFKANKDGYWAAAWFTPNSRYVNAYSLDDYVDVR
ncbi:hypothetical protein Pth03_21280 [Planotetraspora thailandica]|uniref:Carboxypeptidase regulatory-like domain-containing protein n=2 Tax=Planotetraspora thailandica TaxID=487172 RepID=A0A8J3UX93_9ACTN|nr:hypothetical protein Pth03_21280 [Planotetraspora thailandica]